MDGSVSKILTGIIHKLLHIRLGILICGLAIALIVAVSFPILYRNPSGTRDTGYALFCDAYIQKDHVDFDKRTEAAASLARQPGAEAWTVLLLLDVGGQTPFGGEASALSAMEAGFEKDANDEKAEELERFERGVVAAVLWNIPNDAAPAVLWAVTTKLSVSEWGYYSTSSGVGSFTLVRADGKTPPIRDIARETLRRCLGVDHGYDPFQWRTEFVNRLKGAE